MERDDDTGCRDQLHRVGRPKSDGDYRWVLLWRMFRRQHILESEPRHWSDSIPGSANSVARFWIWIGTARRDELHASLRFILVGDDSDRLSRLRQFLRLRKFRRGLDGDKAMLKALKDANLLGAGVATLAAAAGEVTF